MKYDINRRKEKTMSKNPSPPFTIGTFNIRFDNPKDGKNAWKFRKDLMAKVILEHSPDILATQEGRKPQLSELKKLIKNYDLIEIHRQWIPERMYPSLFIKKKMFNVLASGDLWLSETPYVPGSKSFGSAFPRLCTWAKLEIKNHPTAQQFYFFNFHLDHVKSETRVAQIHVFLEELKKINQESLPLCMVGDFNDSPKGDIYNILLNSSQLDLYDPWKAMNYDEETSYHHFDKNDDFKGARIDWILLNKKIQIQTLQFDKRHEKGLYPSDHYPLFAQIQF